MIKPLGELILVEPEMENSSSSLVIPDSAKQEKMLGTVVAVGNSFPYMNIHEGNTVMFGKYSGEVLEHEGKSFRFLKPDEVLALVEK